MACKQGQDRLLKISIVLNVLGRGSNSITIAFFFLLLLRRGGGIGRRCRGSKGFSNCFSTSSKMVSSRIFSTTSWRAGADVDLSRYFCVLIAARLSAYFCRVIDPCCGSALSSLTTAASILIYVSISESDFSRNGYAS